MFASQPDEARRKPQPLAPILAINFVGALGFSIVLPFLVFLVTRCPFMNGGRAAREQTSE